LPPEKSVESVIEKPESMLMVPGDVPGSIPAMTRSPTEAGVTLPAWNVVADALVPPFSVPNGDVVLTPEKAATATEG
jgi:hypothetical protein